jgi:23S rRNA pseudouridine2605 synthase
MRLQKFLARAGVASRRASEELIAAGRVRVDGVVVDVPGVRVDPGSSIIEVDGQRVTLGAVRWLAVHKPPGYLCSRGDPRGRPTVYDLLPEGELRRLFHVGRLDYMSEGLLLLTNDGDAANALLHPAAETPRRYEVTVRAPVPDRTVTRLLEGIELEDGPARATEASITAERDGEQILRITLREGRNREIRRIMEALGLVIHSLRRVAIGPIELGSLKSGEWRELSGRERAAITGTRRAAAEPDERQMATRPTTEHDR